MTAQRVAVVGSTGFVGSAVVDALERDGHVVVRIRAPRLEPIPESQVRTFLDTHPEQIAQLRHSLEGVDAVVNAAGIATATSRETGHLVAANAVLPGLLAAAVSTSGHPRFVHISSAAVQGRRPVLDESWEYDAFSTYSRSKRLGEELAVEYSLGAVTIYRPPGVHGPQRAVTLTTAKVAASPLASVAAPPDLPSPQALIDNVAAAVAYLATCAASPPRVVIHPWEGLTTTDVMLTLGGRRPHVIPRPLARVAAATATTMGRLSPWLAGNARRLEMMWFGQAQADSWLIQSGWSLPYGRKAWTELGMSVRGQLGVSTMRREGKS